MSKKLSKKPFCFVGRGGGGGGGGGGVVVLLLSLAILPKKFDNQRTEFEQCFQGGCRQSLRGSIGCAWFDLWSVALPQECELKKAIFCQGEYRMAPNYKKLEVNPLKLKAMPEEQRNLHVKRLVGLDLFNDDTCPSGHISRPTQVNLSKELLSFSKKPSYTGKCVSGLLSFSKQLLWSDHIVHVWGLFEVNKSHHIR